MPKTTGLAKFTNWLFGNADYLGQPQIRRARFLFISMLVLLLLIFWQMLSLHFNEYCTNYPEICESQDQGEDNAEVAAAEKEALVVEAADGEVVEPDAVANQETETQGEDNAEGAATEEEALVVEDADQEEAADGEPVELDAVAAEETQNQGEDNAEGAATEEKGPVEEEPQPAQGVAGIVEKNGPSDWMGKYQTPPWQWLDWVLAAFVGVLLYLLANIAFFYQKAYRYYEIHGKEPPALRISSTDYPRIEEELGPEKPKFINFTPWYISTIVKAPVITVVILVLLTSIDFKFAGIEFDFSSLDAQVLLMIAFVLGFYSRVAREQLNVIVKAIFGRAYSRAEEVFHVRPREAEVLIGGNCDFCTSPSTEVTWVTSAGTIDNHGLFVAPAANERSAVSGGTVLITAVPTDPNIPRATAAVTLRSYIIIGPQAIGYNVPAAQPYKIDPTIPPGDVIWSIESPDYGASITDTGSLTGPDEVKAKAGKAEYITITATSKKDDTKYAELKVYLE